MTGKQKTSYENVFSILVNDFAKLKKNKLAKHP